MTNEQYSQLVSYLTSTTQRKLIFTWAITDKNKQFKDIHSYYQLREKNLVVLIDDKEYSAEEALTYLRQLLS